MSPFFWIIVAADVVGFLLLLRGMLAAPVAWEDSSGLRAGEEPVPVRISERDGPR